MKGGHFDPQLGGQERRGGRRQVHSIARPRVAISSPLTYGLSHTAFELFNRLRKRFRPSDPDTMTIAALLATVSSNAKKGNRTDRANYRPVSLTPVPYKATEKIIKDKLSHDAQRKILHYKFIRVL